MPESIAQSYFDRFTSEDAAAVLSNLPNTNPKTFEDNWLDFKSGRPKPDDLQQIWAKALGGMANAGGGVIVWGIVAAKHGKPPVDAAESLDLVPDVNVLASRLIELQRFATDPPLIGVQVKPIPKDDSSTEGFVVCLIPEGTTKPYMSLKTKKPFYLRMGDESKEPPLPILRQLFNPQQKTQAVIEASCTTNKALGRCNFKFTLRNVGAASIQNPFISIRALHELLLGDSFVMEIPPIHGFGSALHPEMTFTVEAGCKPKNRIIDFIVTLYQENNTPHYAEFTYEILWKSFEHRGEGFDVIRLPLTAEVPFSVRPRGV